MTAPSAGDAAVGAGVYHAAIVDGIAEHGYAIVPQFFDAGRVNALRGRAQAALAESRMQAARIGRAAASVRAHLEQYGVSVGIVFDLNVAEPASEDPRDIAATRRFDGAQNRWFLDAVFKGAYPRDMLELYGDLLPQIHADDNATIAAPIDYVGVNIYRRSVIAAGDELAPLSFRRVQPEGNYSAVGYEIYPRCMYDILRYVSDGYAPKAIYISENGVATTPERVGADGRVWDDLRATYYVDHLEQVAKAAAEGEAAPAEKTEEAAAKAPEGL